MTSIIIPKSVTYIDNGNGRDYAGAFSYCHSLTSIVVEEGNPVYDSRDNCNAIIKTSAHELIVGCQTTVIPSNLSSVKLPNSLTEIGNDVFHDDSRITSITIPSGVTSIGDKAFFDCNGMISVTSLAVEPIDISESEEVFVAACSIYENATLKVPFGSKAKYQAAGGWKDFVNIVELGDVNGDNTISITDAVAILDFLSDKEPENFNVAVADMDGDGEITVSDAISILNMILND